MIPKETIIMINVLNERVAFASSSYRIFVKVDKFQLSEGFENLLDVGFREVEVERTNIKSGENQNWINAFILNYVLHGTSVRRTDTRGKIQISATNSVRIGMLPNWIYIPVSWMKSVPFGFGQLDHDRQTHHYCATERKSLVDHLNCTKLHIANSGPIRQNGQHKSKKKKLTL